MGALRRARKASSMLSAPVEVHVAQGSRLTLRPLAPTDREAFVDVLRRSRRELDAFAPLHFEGESDEALFERQLHLTQDGERTGNAHRRIGVLEDGSIAGAFNFNAISRGMEMRADLNFWVATDHAGRGVATEGVRTLVDHGVKPLPHGLGLHLIEAGVKRDNLASVRVLEKIGFKRAGEDRTHLATGAGWSLHDIYAYRLSATG